MSELLPCPLCDAHLFRNGASPLGDIYEHPANGCAIQVAWFTATPKWIAAWNRRSVPAVSEEAIERVAEAVYSTLLFGNDLSLEGPDVRDLYRKIARAAISAQTSSARVHDLPNRLGSDAVDR